MTVSIPAQDQTETVMANRLINETSPYLLAHAYNPVDWHPWDKQAFEQARKQDKPVLLSIGYYACHWCHVMARESFEDPEIAQIMNDGFINIKVDREQRPDLDHIYQTAFQIIHQRPGGWPLTVFLTPDQLPFFAGTYFPKEPHPQMIDFATLLGKIQQVWHQNREQLTEDGQAIKEALGRLHSSVKSSDQSLSTTYIPHQTFEELTNHFDGTYGGLGSSPKFPQPVIVNYLLDYSYWANNEAAYQLAELTLKTMVNGGLYDHLRGGFYRYCVDRDWQIPHFEKMLYDNAQLLDLYSYGYALTQNVDYLEVIHETRQWLMNEMLTSEGGYIASLSAESEGEEGRFYIWSRQQIQNVLASNQYDLIESYYGLDRAPNFDNHWHLTINKSIKEVARENGMTIDEAKSSIEKARTSLFHNQNKRARPRADNKILTGWNALTAKALSRVAMYTEADEALTQSQHLLDFIYQNLYQNNRLYTSFKDNVVQQLAFIDDYAFLIEALTAVLQLKWRPDYWQWLWQLIDIIQHHFEDQTNGGFYLTSDEHETLIDRPKPYTDASVPGANGVIAQTFSVLGYLCGDSRLLDSAYNTLVSNQLSLERSPLGHTSMVKALLAYLQPPEMLVVRAPQHDLASFHHRYLQYFSPGRWLWLVPNEASELPMPFANKSCANNEALVYPCQGRQCFEPVSGLDGFTQYLA